MRAAIRPPEVVIAVTEPFTATTVEPWVALVDVALTMAPVRLVLDFRHCPEIDAVGIGCLLQLHRRMRCDDQRLTLRTPTPKVRRMLRLGRVNHILDIEPHLEGGV